MLEIQNLRNYVVLKRRAVISLHGKSCEGFNPFFNSKCTLPTRRNTFTAKKKKLRSNNPLDFAVRVSIISHEKYLKHKTDFCRKAQNFFSC